MAQLTLGVIGGAIGSYYGMGGVGFAIGSAIGGVVDAVAFSEDNNGNPGAPKLGDLKVSGSTYGEMIPLGYGTIRMKGNIVWLSYRDEIAEIESSGGGKGSAISGGGSQTVGYDVERFASWAMIFAEGPAEDLIALWADGKKVWDKAEDVELYNNQGFQFRFYKGDDIQVPDSLIEADRGEGNVPAYRHRAYVVFEDIPLSKFGGRIPNITAEITFKKTRIYPSVSLETTGFTSFDINSFTFDPVTRKIYGHGTDTDGDQAIAVWQQRYDATNLVFTKKIEDIVGPTWPGYDFSPPAVPELTGLILHVPANPTTNPQNPEGILFIHTEQIRRAAGIEYFDMARVDAATLTYIDRDYQVVPSLQHKEFQASGCVAQANVRDTDTGAVYPYYHVYSSASESNGSLNVYDATNGDLIDQFASLGRGWVNGPPETDASVAYGIGNNAIYKVRTYRVYSQSGAPEWEVEYTLLQSWSYTGSPLDAPIPGVTGMAVLPDFYGGFYDPTTDRIYYTLNFDLEAGGTSTAFVKFNPNNDMAVEDYFFLAGLRRQISQGSRATFTTDGTVLFGINDTSNSPTVSGSRVIKVDLNSMEIVQELNSSDFSPVQDFTSFNTIQIYDPYSHSITTLGVSPVIAYYERGDGQGETLATVVADISVNHVGLDASDIDVTELTDTVRGYAITRQAPAKRAIEQLQSAYFFDPVQVDGKIKFLKRGRSATFTIDPNDMRSPNGDGNFWTPERAEDIEIPHEVWFTFQDIDRDYQESTAVEKRTRQPVATMQSEEKMAVAVPIVFTHEEGRAIAERHLYRAWIERNSFKTTIPWKYLKNHPAEVGSVSFSNGLSYTIRMLSMSVGADLSLGVDFTSEDVSVYTPSGKTGDGGATPPNTVEVWQEGRLFVLDTPLLQDEDTGSLGVSTTYYVAMGGIVPNVPYTGGIVYRSQDGQSWDTRVAASGSTPHGVATTILGNTNSPFTWDDTNTLTVRMTVNGAALQSTTDSAVLNGANGAALYNENGVEIIQFVNATENADGTYTLSRLLRGRRGSDVFTGIHTASDTFVLLSPAYTHRDTVQISLLDATLYFLGMSTGEIFDQGRALPKVLKGRASFPYAPTQVSRSDDFVSSPAGITISWVRRTRLGGENIKGNTTVPDVEGGGFVIQIMSGESDPAASPPGTILRTLTAVKGETSVLYTEAQIATDFGSPVPATIYARVMEVSSDTGNGFWYEWALVDGQDEGTRVHAGEKDTILW